MDTLEEDFRAWIAADAGVAGLVGINVYFTAIPTKVDGGFIGTRCARKDAMRTTAKVGGRLTLAKIVCSCCFKGADPVLGYVRAKAIAQAVKSRVNSADGTWIMGTTKVYQVTIDDNVEEGQADTETDAKFDYHAGASSGIQHVDIAVAFHYWSPNS